MGLVVEHEEHNIINLHEILLASSFDNNILYCSIYM